jgi:hypothetical protein
MSGLPDNKADLERTLPARAAGLSCKVGKLRKAPALQIESG